MQIHNYHNQTTFGNRYPLENILGIISPNIKMPKSTFINTVADMNKLKHKQINELIYNAEKREIYRKNTSQHIFCYYPELGKWKETLSSLKEDPLKLALETLKAKFGDTIEIKQIIKSKKE